MPTVSSVGKDAASYRYSHVLALISIASASADLRIGRRYVPYEWRRMSIFHSSIPAAL